MARREIRFLTLAVAALCFTLGFGIPVSPVHAGEGYGTPYPGGNEDFFAGALPPGGTKVFLNYFMYLDSTKLRDKSGHEQSVYGPPGTPVAGQNLGKADWRLQVVANVFRYVDVTKVKLFGGDFLWHVIVPVIYEHASLGYRGLGAIPAGDVFTGSTTGLGDVEAGVGIAWHPSKTFHHLAAFDFVAPTGSYNANNRDVNISNHYWSFSPIWAFTYIGDKGSPLPGFEVSSKFMYWFNTINTDTSYTSGQMFMADYLVAQHFGNWGFGANGHLLYQTTNDKQNGRTAFDPFTGAQTGVESRYFSIGPAIQYNLPNHGCITVKYQWDVWDENRPQANKLWVKFVWPF